LFLSKTELVLCLYNKRCQQARNIPETLENFPWNLFYVLEEILCGTNHYSKDALETQSPKKKKLPSAHGPPLTLQRSRLSCPRTLQRCNPANTAASFRSHTGEQPCNHTKFVAPLAPPISLSLSLTLLSFRSHTALSQEN
jgi:hypothetical protein